MQMPIQKFEKIFSSAPLQGAEYLGECAKISIVLGCPAEAAVRARLAARFAGKVLDGALDRLAPASEGEGK